MPKRPLRKLFLFILVFLLTYLLAAAVWAWATIDRQVDRYRVGAHAELTRNQMKMIFAIEDPTFLHHRGLSLAKGQGKATITSAVTANALFYHKEMPGIAGGFQRLFRGVFECCKKIDIGRDVMTLVVASKVPKEKQLAMYASDVYLGTHEGKQVRGFEQGALAYAKVPLAKVTDAQFAALVAMIKAPNEFHPVRNPAAYRERVKRVTAIVTGSCQPDGYFDTTYVHCGR